MGRLGPTQRASSTSRRRLWWCCSDDLTSAAVPGPVEQGVTMSAPMVCGPSSSFQTKRTSVVSSVAIPIIIIEPKKSRLLRSFTAVFSWWPQSQCSCFSVPAGSPSRGGGSCRLCQRHEPTALAHSFLFCSCVFFLCVWSLWPFQLYFLP